jgi:hypothetical protein
MLTTKSKRKVRGDSKQHPQTPLSSNCFGDTRNSLKRLSFSFYGEDTIKRCKQIIFDDCGLIEDSADLNGPGRPKARKSHNPICQSQGVSKSKKKDSVLEMEHFFF